MKGGEERWHYYGLSFDSTANQFSVVYLNDDS